MTASMKGKYSYEVHDLDRKGTTGLVMRTPCQIEPALLSAGLSRDVANKMAEHFRGSFKEGKMVIAIVHAHENEAELRMNAYTPYILNYRPGFPVIWGLSQSKRQPGKGAQVAKEPVSGLIMKAVHYTDTKQSFEKIKTAVPAEMKMREQRLAPRRTESAHHLAKIKPLTKKQHRPSL